MGRLILVILIAVSAVVVAPVQAQSKIATVVARNMNVRAAPNVTSQILGVAQRGATFPVSAKDESGLWLNVLYQGNEAWITARPEYVRVSGGIADLPTYQAIPKTANILMTQYSISPLVPEPGQPFAVAITLQNKGTDAAGFNLAVNFAGGYFALTDVPGMASGAAGTLTINNPGEMATGKFTVPLVIDPEMKLGLPQSNQSTSIIYKIDRAYETEAAITIAPDMNIDLWGGRPDLYLDRDGLQALDNTLFQVLDLPISEVHHDMISPKETLIYRDRLVPGALIGVKVNEGRIGVLRVTAVSGEQVTVQYVIYR
jgi:uncharacterized protein YraI